jgi:hypothetical protein
MHIAGALREKGWYYNRERLRKGSMYPHQYKTREVRDLAWACFSQSLFHSEMLSSDKPAISSCGLVLTDERQAWLAELDRSPAPLHRHLQTLHNTRLGLYFESLWHFFLQSDPLIDLVAHNLPIRDGGRTLGEFDCLYYCHLRAQHFHLELAVKYYLSNRQVTKGSDTSQWMEWLGPTNTDNLERKIQHLTQHQIKLGEHPIAVEAMRALNIQTPAREIEIKGYLFQGIQDPLSAPRGHNCENGLRHWLTIVLLPDYLASSESWRFCQLDKPYWLAPATAATHANALLDKVEIAELMAQHFTGGGRPVMLAGFNKAGEECQRFFVTGPQWPADSGKPFKTSSSL